MLSLAVIWEKNIENAFTLFSFCLCYDIICPTDPEESFIEYEVININAWQMAVWW